MLTSKDTKNTDHSSWKNKISHHAQLGGIETAILDNGTGRGTRIAWINTGTGLRYKVVIDRAMDIADAFFNEHSLGWISPSGVTYPQPFSNQGINWLKTFGGGLLTTCGLSHTGGPESDEYGERGLHGDISNVPATIESVIQPDPVAGKLEMSITGIINETRIFGPSLQLRRTISGKLGEPFLQIRDEVTNRGNTTAPHMLLYHINLGWPIADEGTDIIWKGKWKARDNNPKIFTEGNNFKKCPAPLTDHNAGGEEAAFIDAVADASGVCSCGLYNKRLGIAVKIDFLKEQLPWLINWQHWGHGEYVTGIEPATYPPVGQAKARALKTLILLEPGEKRVYDLKLQVLQQTDDINAFVSNQS
ncbi:MAG: aldose 1-epimerase family protein [Agriterribacter sp.]